MGRYEDLEKIDALRRSGVLTDEEFHLEKDRILRAPEVPSLAAEVEVDQPWGVEPRSFLMLMHLSTFAGLAVPMAGVVMPIVMWATCKDGRPEVDRHGRIIFDWMLSKLIYLLVSGILCFVVIGIPLLIGLLICDLVFTIIGAMKARDGIVWRYPLSIRFFG